MVHKIFNQRACVTTGRHLLKMKFAEPSKKDNFTHVSLTKYFQDFHEVD